MNLTDLKRKLIGEPFPTSQDNVDHFSAVAAGSGIQELKTPIEHREPMVYIKDSRAACEENASAIPSSYITGI